MGPVHTRRRWGLGVAALIGASAAAWAKVSGAKVSGAEAAGAEPGPPPPGPLAPGRLALAPPPEVLKSQTDADDRMTVKVRINGQGPYAFVVDTGAERSALSAELAASLMTPPGPPMVVHGVAGQVVAATTLVDELAVGSRRLRGQVLPLLTQANIGAAGVLGIDALQGQRVELDFLRREIRVQAAPVRPALSDEIVVAARSRFGQLVLVDAAYERSPILVVVDTGAEKSIGNLALRRRVRPESLDLAANAALIYSVTGQTTGGEWAVINHVQVGGFGVNRLPVVFADLHAFDRWRLTDQPALLLGMDVLRQFDRVDIDFARREVRFRGAGATNDRRWSGAAQRLG